MAIPEREKLSKSGKFIYDYMCNISREEQRELDSLWFEDDDRIYYSDYEYYEKED